jgi:hypothetical protein
MKCTESQDRNWTREAPYYRSSLLMIISRDISLRSAKYYWTQRQNLTSKKEIEKIENTVDKAVIKTAAVLFDQGEKYSFNVVKDISSEIITKSNDEHSSV